MSNLRFVLYHYPGVAIRSGRVKWLLHELVGDSFDVKIISLIDAQQYSAEFLRLNPNHGVPVLEIAMGDDEVVTMIESGAMVSFLADIYPQKQMAPAPSVFSEGRADYLQMLHFGSSWMDMMLWQIRIHEHLLPHDQQDARTIARYRRKFEEEVEPQLIRRLTIQSHICGDSFSAADCVVGHNILWAKAYGLCKDRCFDIYVEALAKREAFSQVFADVSSMVREVPEHLPFKKKFTG